MILGALLNFHLIVFFCKANEIDIEVFFFLFNLCYNYPYHTVREYYKLS
jgi:hypothetical protein